MTVSPLRFSPSDWKIPLLPRRAPVRGIGLALAVWLLGVGIAYAQDLTGAWRLERFEGGGSVGPASGQLTFADGRFSLVYTMDQKDQSTAGRAHAGGYATTGQTLTLQVDWSMQIVGDKPSVTHQPSENVTQFSLSGDQLTVRYKSGGVMQFRRVRPAPELSAVCPSSHMHMACDQERR